MNFFHTFLQENELQDVIDKNTQLTVQNSDLQKRLQELEKVRQWSFLLWSDDDKPHCQKEPSYYLFRYWWVVI